MITTFVQGINQLRPQPLTRALSLEPAGGSAPGPHNRFVLHAWYVSSKIFDSGATYDHSYKTPHYNNEEAWTQMDRKIVEWNTKISHDTKHHIQNK